MLTYTNRAVLPTNQFVLESHADKTVVICIR